MNLIEFIFILFLNWIEAARARVSMTTEQSGCHCCPSRSNPFPAQRWAPYNTQTSSMMAARHGCPAPASVVFQQQQQESWTRWNDSSVSLDQLILQTTPHYNNNNNHPSSSSSSLMAFHIWWSRKSHFYRLLTCINWRI